MARAALQYVFPPTSELLQDPYPAYAQLRAEAPVFKASDSSPYLVPGQGPRMSNGDYVISRFEDVREIFSDWRRFSVMHSKTGLDTPNVLEIDPPIHKERRSFQSKIIAPRRLEKYDEVIRAFAIELVESFLERGAFEAPSEFTYPLALYTMSGMLGFDQRSNYEWLAEWVEEFEGSGAVYKSEGTIDRQKHAWVRLIGVVEKLLDERLTTPKDDLLSELAEGQRVKLGQVDRPILSIDAAAVIVAGLHTTAAQLANTILLLCDYPEQAERIYDDPSLVAQLGEESLRYEASVQWQARIVTENVEVAGVPIPAGAKAILLLGAANRDPAGFDDPDRFDIFRPNAFEHTSFGAGGPHYCLGAPLARLEMRVALEELCKRARNFRLKIDRDELRWQDHNIVFRTPAHLPVEFDRV